MPKSYRIRTEIGKDKAIHVNLEQDFEYLEILSLKILQSDIYTRVCSDYGVVVGRLSVNNGTGLPNCKVSIFIPLSQEDEDNAIISELYPYKTLNDVNDEGYRYNLLPYTKSHGGHRPTGTFPTRNDVLTNQTLIEVYDKYYKFTVKTNDSGDFMIFGVPLGTQTIHIDVDLSDIGEFSMTPQDLVRIGLATESQVSGTEFKTSSNLGELPQILQFNRIIEVFPLWGQPEVCTLGITRSDFDLTEEASITLEPAAVFMGSIFSNQDKRAVKKNCRVNRKLGNLCQLIAGPGEILAIRQTIGLDSSGRPVLEEFQIGEGGKVIDDNGTWLVDLPMNMDFVYTNEFGERTFSSDPKVGVPTKAKYRFKVKWEQPQTLQGKVKRASFLVPNIKEWGWSTSGTDPYTGQDVSDNNCSVPSGPSPVQVSGSYAFSLDWNDYGTNDMIQEAIKCEDRFFEFNYNKVYTVAELISEYRSNSGNKKFIAIRDILDETCENTNNPFPTNDAIFQFDILYLLFSIVALILKPVLSIVLFLAHIVGWMVCKMKDIVCGIKKVACKVGIGCGRWKERCSEWRDKCEDQQISLPLLTYPDCELCECAAQPEPQPTTGSLANPPLDEGENIFTSPILNFSSGTTLNQPNLLPLMAVDSVSDFICDTATGTATLPSTTTRSFTMSIPFSEKINLFNTKAKYFDEDSTVSPILNPGGGVNRIKVWFNINSPQNDINTQYHYDNVFIMILPPLPPAEYEDVGPTPLAPQQGDVLRFSDESTPTDPNVIYYTGITYSQYNPYGTKGVTGITDPSWTAGATHPDPPSVNPLGGSPGYTFTRTIPYANYQSQSNLTPGLSTTYEIFISEEDTKAMRFGFDDEYFQVIYTGDVSTFIGNAVGQSTAPNSFVHRFLNGQMKIVTNTYDNPFSPPTFINPDDCTMSPPLGVNCSDIKLDNQTSTVYKTQDVLDDYLNYRVVVMVRGVDPHSTKVMCRYDLGALFGLTLPTGGGFTSNYVEFPAHLNIPIQPSMAATSHNIVNSDDTDTYSGNKLYFDTFGFTPDPSQFQNFYSQKPLNYSSLDANNPGGAPASAYELAVASEFLGPDTQVLTINRTNDYVRDLYYSFTPNPDDPGTPNLSFYDNTPTAPVTISSDENELNFPGLFAGGFPRNMGYFRNEVVEGGSLLHIPTYPQNPFTWDENAWISSPLEEIDACSPSMPQHLYYGQKYTSPQGMFVRSGSSQRQLVMRSDRLPVSDIPTNSNPNGNTGGSIPPNTPGNTLTTGNQNSLIGFSNPLFNVSVLDPAGEGNTAIVPGPSDNQADNIENQNDLGNTAVSSIASSFSCEGIVPLACYEVDNVTGFVTVLPPGNKCATNNCCNDDRKTKCKDCDGDSVMQFGCYTLVTDPWKSRKVDKYLMNEWLLRLRISFAACRNVWGHMFTNQWVNGTLFAFPFQVQTRFTSPGSSNPNQPYACYCDQIVYFDFNTNNFYYRSSPYNSSDGFIGRGNKGGGYGGNIKILGNPTTIMDLGPVNDYMDELSYSEDFLGYVVDRLDSTSFQDVDEILNLNIIQRLVSQSVRQIIKDTARIGGNNDPVKRFFSRNNNKVDGDYAQMIAINSQIGVIPYDSGLYTNPTDVYFSRGDANDSVFGIFFSANTQIRDWITPKRTIVSPGSDPSYTCTFDEFPIFSQEIPMFLWQVKPNQNTDNIFGGQKNDWFTDVLFLNGQFNHIQYQSIDRIDGIIPYGSRTMQPTDESSESNFKGYIYNVIGGVNTASLNTTPTGYRTVNNTAPFYFYFGLIKGSSAYDRFLTKWVKKDTNKF
jgi:hypothetical protein